MSQSHRGYRRLVLDFVFVDLVAAPKLAPEPVAAPEANGVENSELPGVVLEPKAGAALPNKEGVEADANKDDDEDPKSDVWGVAPDDPNREDTGAEVVGVANREDGTEEGAEVGVPKRLPEEANVVAADVCWAVDDAPRVPELVSNPATCVDGCEFAGKCKVGCTLLAAASCLAVSRRSASRNGSFPSPRRRWSAR